MKHKQWWLPGALLAAMVWPVAGLRASRAARCLVEKAPKPMPADRGERLLYAGRAKSANRDRG